MAEKRVSSKHAAAAPKRINESSSSARAKKEKKNEYDGAPFLRPFPPPRSSTALRASSSSVSKVSLGPVLCLFITICLFSVACTCLPKNHLGSVAQTPPRLAVLATWHYLLPVDSPPPLKTKQRASRDNTHTRVKWTAHPLAGMQG